MTESIANDRRGEVKFVAPEMEYRHVLEWVRLNRAGFRQPYPARWVNSAYFDTYDLHAYHENLAGVSRRTKVRYRWYGDLAPIGAGHLEIKTKRDRSGGKLLHRVERPPAGDTWRATIQGLIAQLPPAGALWLHLNPQPVIVNRYRREYFVSADGKVRATVDTEGAVFDQRYGNRPQLVEPANLPRTVVLEIKFAPEHRDLAADLLSDVPIRVGRNSKFAIGLKSIDGR